MPICRFEFKLSPLAIELSHLATYTVLATTVFVVQIYPVGYNLLALEMAYTSAIGLILARILMLFLVGDYNHADLFFDLMI